MVFFTFKDFLFENRYSIFIRKYEAFFSLYSAYLILHLKIAPLILYSSLDINLCLTSFSSASLMASGQLKES